MPAIVVLSLFALVLSARGAAQDILRYRFDVGERVVYERRVDITSLDGATPPRRVTEQLTLWLLDTQADQTQLLIEITPVEPDGRAGAVRGATLWVDRWGQIRWPRVSLRRWSEVAPALDLLISLPSALLRPESWQTAPDPVGRTLRCTRRGSDAENPRRTFIEFTEDDPTGANLAARRQRSGRITFDALQGRVLAVESIEEDRLAGLRSLSVLRLFRVYEQTSDWRRARLGELARYEDLLNLEDRLTDELGNAAPSAAPIVQRLTSAWTALAAEWERISDSPLRRLAETRRRTTGDLSARLSARARLAARWHNQPAPDWELESRGGERVRSDAFADRVQVEVYWSAASLDSLRTLEGARRLAQEAGERAHVLCLSVDPDGARAREAADACAGAPHVLLGAGGLIEAGWLDLPIIRVLSPQRRVLAAYFGWRPDLMELVRAHLPAERRERPAAGP